MNQRVIWQNYLWSVKSKISSTCLILNPTENKEKRKYKIPSFMKYTIHPGNSCSFRKFFHSSGSTSLIEPLWLEILLFFIIIFFCMHKKKVLESRKFSTHGFWWIYIFWYVLNTIWLFLEKVCMYVSILQNFVHGISRTNERKLMKFYIQLHLDIILSWLHFGVCRSRSSDVTRNFWFL